MNFLSAPRLLPTPGKSVWIYLALALLALNGCTTQPERKPIYCPPPPKPVCSPGKFDKVLLDTNFHGIGRMQPHISELPVPINSQAQDNAITFVPMKSGLVALTTSNRSSVGTDAFPVGQQRLYAARFLSTMQYGPLKPVQTGDFPAPVGLGHYCTANGLFYFTSKAQNADPEDYDLFVGKLEERGEDIVLTNVRAIAALNSPGHFDAQPTLDPTGLNIYFVSDRPDGNGGTDIWHSTRTSTANENWSAPEPLAPPVNSACDEISPYISPRDGHTLYFASNGHETVGGYDLFKSEMKDGVFSTPENLGIPINTPYDEAFPVALNDTAFFWSSNMPGNQAGFNLYTITRTLVQGIAAKPKVAEPERPEVGHMHIDTLKPEPPKPLGPVMLEVHVTRGAYFYAAIGAFVFVRRDSGLLYRGAVPSSGTIAFKVLRDQEYDVGAETADAFFDVKHVDLRNYADSTKRVDLHLPDTLVLRINFPFDDYLHPYEFVIDENGQPSGTTWKETLDLAATSILQSKDKLRQVVVIGHTDSLGTDAYNEKLGERRASFVADQLIARGVPRALLVVESRGRTQPVAMRPDEADEIFRMRSRRVQLIKVFK